MKGNAAGESSAPVKEEVSFRSPLSSPPHCCPRCSTVADRKKWKKRRLASDRTMTEGLACDG